MRKTVLLLGAYLQFPCVCRSEVIGFDNDPPGSVPRGWVVAMTHKGGPPRWEVLRDDAAPSRPNVFAQTSTDATAGRFPLAILEKMQVANGTISVKFKAMSGTVDQAAGLVWRYRDPDNYYIVRANALEDNVVLYKVQNGQRLALAPKGSPSKTYGVKHRIPKRSWNTLAVTFEANLFIVSFGGEKLFEVIDSTFSGAGKVGLWTKADSVTYFDDLQVVRNTEPHSR
jgi:hypothetical protein